MAVTAFWYGQSILGQYSGTAARRVDWVNDTIKVALLTSSYTPDQDNHVFYSDLTNEVAAGGGYTTGGAALASKSTSYDSATNETRLIAGNTTWTSSTITARYAAVYKDTGTGSTSPLLGYVDFGANVSTSSGTFEIDWDATLGVLYIQAS